MNWLREFNNADRAQAFTAILVELPPQVLHNFQFDDRAQVASFDVIEPQIVVDEPPELDDLEAEPERGRIALFFSGLFKRNGDA